MDAPSALGRPRDPLDTRRVVLVVEDRPGDARLTQEAFRDANRGVHVHVATDGVEAMAFLRRDGLMADAPRPDLILLDLNMPRLGGHKLLAQIKTDERLRTIPTVILTTSSAERDVVRSYDLHANAYVTKPVDLEEFESLIRCINDFWLTRVAPQPGDPLWIGFGPS